MAGSAGSKYGIISDAVPVQKTLNLRRLTMKQYSVKFSGILRMTFGDDITKEDAAEQLKSAVWQLEDLGNTNIGGSRVYIDMVFANEVTETDMGIYRPSSTVTPMKAKVTLDTNLLTQGDDK